MSLMEKDLLNDNLIALKTSDYDFTRNNHEDSDTILN